jgi:type III pantothenate kinase
MSYPCFVAVDIGNARTKLGLFAGGCAAGLPEPTRVLPLLGDAPELDAVTPWLSESVKNCSRHIPRADKVSAHGVCRLPLAWRIASVNRPAATQLIDWLGEHRPDDRVTLLAAGDLPLRVRLERPDMVGIDRLVDAVAVNRLRDANRPAVIVDVGTAITVDLVSADGAFLGGAILPGIQMSARAMHEFTDLLPLVDVSELAAPPPVLGTATVPAMESGLFWGAVGAIRQLIEQLGKFASGGCLAEYKAAAGGRATECKAATSGRAELPQVFLTGGAGETVAELLGPGARYVPHLTLAGIALSATVE